MSLNAIGEALRKGGELIGPIIVRELGKPRTRKFIEQKVEEFAQELGRRVTTTKKSKQFIMRRGGQQFKCRRVR